MFVAMGLSAIFPVLHGLELYGIKQMRDRIGLTWLVLQGFLYILGAGLYAVSFSRQKSKLILSADDNRLAGRNVHGQALSTSGEVRINCSTFWLFWRPHLIFTACSRLLIITMVF